MVFKTPWLTQSFQMLFLVESVFPRSLPMYYFLLQHYENLEWSNSGSDRHLCYGSLIVSFLPKNHCLDYLFIALTGGNHNTKTHILLIWLLFSLHTVVAKSSICTECISSSWFLAGEEWLNGWGPHISISSTAYKQIHYGRMFFSMGSTAYSHIE